MPKAGPEGAGKKKGRGGVGRREEVE